MSGWRPKTTSHRRTSHPAPAAGARNLPTANSAASSPCRTYSPPSSRLRRTAAYGRVAGSNFKGGAQRPHEPPAPAFVIAVGTPSQRRDRSALGRKRRAGGRFPSHHSFSLIFIILHSVSRSETLQHRPDGPDRYAAWRPAVGCVA